jgi:hypothetical protein
MTINANTKVTHMVFMAVPSRPNAAKSAKHLVEKQKFRFG